MAIEIYNTTVKISLWKETEQNIFSIDLSILNLSAEIYYLDVIATAKRFK